MNSRVLPVTSLAFLAVFLGTAAAGPRDDVLEALGKCAQMTDNGQRLSCYDSIAPRLRDALNTPPETLSRPPTKDEQQSWFGFDIGNIFGSTAPKAQTTPQQFGADQIPKPEPVPGTPEAVAQAEEIDSITGALTDYSINPFGKFIIFLDNGQVWRQIPGDTTVLHFRKLASDNTVEIERGALGSYNMHLNGGSSTVKVVRVK